MYVLPHVQDFVGGFNQTVKSVTFYLCFQDNNKSKEGERGRELQGSPTVVLFSHTLGVATTLDSPSSVGYHLELHIVMSSYNGENVIFVYN